MIVDHRPAVTLPPDVEARNLSRAIRDAWTLQDQHHAEVCGAWFIQPYVIVRTPATGRYSLRSWHAWDEPSEAPMLPWSAPTESIVGWVFRDGDTQIKAEYRF